MRSRQAPRAARLAFARVLTAILPFLGLASAEAHAQDRLLPQSRRITDEAIARDRALIDAWRTRAAAAEAARQCVDRVASTQLAFVSREYDLNNRDAAVDSAFAQAVDQVTRLELGAPDSTCAMAPPVEPEEAAAPPAEAPPAVAPLPDVVSPDAVHFGFDRADLSAASELVVDQVAGILRAEPNLEVRLDAHADPAGAADWNHRLSARRGAAVRDRLVEQGVAPARITVVPHGEDVPRGEGPTLRERHASDRRVEMTLQGEGSDRVRVMRQRDDLQVGPARRR
jgi:outer membrane protein OmpA-like peptidoglycan-associated protein